MSRSMKLLIIAAFVASSNSKEEDIFVLTAAQRGRRKRPRQVSSSSVDQHHPIKVGSSSTSRSETVGTLAVAEGDYSSQHPFSAERLLGIYCQIAIIVDGSIPIGEERNPVGGPEMQGRSSGRVGGRADRYGWAIKAHSNPSFKEVLLSPERFAENILATSYGDSALYANVSSRGVINKRYCYRTLWQPILGVGNGIPRSLAGVSLVESREAPVHFHDLQEHGASSLQVRRIPTERLCSLRKDCVSTASRKH